MDEYYMQYVATACAGLAVASTSVHVLWPSVALPNILSGNSSLPQELTQDEISWIVMSLFLGTIPGAMISGWLLNKIGRRLCILLLTAPLFLLWIPIAFAHSVWLVCVERCAAGIAISAIIIVVTLYNSEIADKNVRGKLGTTLNGWSLFGEFIVTCTGPYLSYQNLAIINCVLPLISVILIYFMPESPYYLVQVGKREEAKTNLTQLLSARNFVVDVDAAMNEIENTIEIDKKNKSSMWNFLTEPLYRKSLIIVFGMKLLQQLSGSSAFGSFTDSIVATSQANYTREEWEIILNAIPLVGVLICGAYVDKGGRKTLLIISLIGCAITLIIGGVCCMLQDYYKNNIQHLSWLAISSLIIYSMARSLGIGTLPYVLMGELFATNIRHHAVAFCGTINAVTGFLMLKYFGKVSDVNGLFIAFWIFAAICILGSLFVYFVIPETKCKSYTEIQEELTKGVNVTRTSAVHLDII